MQLYYLVNGGDDGHASVDWFKHESYAQHLIDTEEVYYINEEVGSITLPDGFDVSSLRVYVDAGEVT